MFSTKKRNPNLFVVIHVLNIVALALIIKLKMLVLLCAKIVLYAAISKGWLVGWLVGLENT